MRQRVVRYELGVETVAAFLRREGVSMASGRPLDVADDAFTTLPSAGVSTRVLSRRGRIAGRPVVIQIARSEGPMREQVRDLTLVLVLVGLAGTLVPSPALAGSKGGGGAAVPFTQADCGDDVDVSVRLTEDVDCSGVATDAIRIDADGISVDLAGHRLIAAYGYSAVVTDYHSGILVTGGTIEVSGQGIGV